jgi:hypothetical protein
MLGAPDNGALVLAAGVTVGPEAVAYVGVGGMLALLFRLVFRTLAVKDTEVERHMRRLTSERDRAQAWERWQSARADHWYAVALGDPNPPPIPAQPIDAPLTADPSLIQPPK